MKDSGLFLAKDYPLTADEISSLPLSSVKLCILSACYSGLGKSKGSEGIFGLRRGFFLAGCQNLLISLWSIHDFSGMLFIKHFMDNLIIYHLNTLEALQDTKNIMRTRTIKEWKPYWQEQSKTLYSKVLLETVQSYLYQNDDYIPFEHPYYWAGFQLLGNPVSFV
jgi:CHAT domain-containing protein